MQSDYIEQLLNGTKLPRSHKADLWDIYHNTKDSGELAQHLQPLNVPDDLKRRMYIAKQSDDADADAAKTPVDRVVDALLHLGTIHPDVLAASEQYPVVAKALIAHVGSKGEPR